MALPTDFGSPATPGYALPSEQSILNRLSEGTPLSEPEKEQFRAYKTAQEVAGAPLFPTVADRRHKQATAAETMVLDGWDAFAAKGVGDKAKFDLVPEDQRPATARALWLSNQFNQPFKQIFDQLPAYEMKYAQQSGPVQDPTAEVEKQMKLSLQRQRDQRGLLFGTPGKKGTGSVSMGTGGMPGYNPNATAGTPDTPAVKGLLQEAHEAALDGKPVVEVLKSLAAMKGKPGFDPQSAQEWAVMAQDVYAKTWQANQAAKDVAAEVFTRLHPDKAEFGDISSVMPLLQGKSFYELGLVWKNIEAMAERDPVQNVGWWEKMSMTLGRNAERLGAGYASGFGVAAENGVNNLKVGTMVPAALADQPRKLIDHLTGQVSADMFSGGGASIADIFKPKEKLVALSKEQSDAVQKALVDKHEEASLLYKLKQIREGVVDPVKGDSYGTGQLLADLGWKITDAGIGMLTYVPPGGLLMNGLSYVQDSAEKFREAGIGYEAAGAMGLVSGGAQMLGDLLELKAMPGLNSLGKAFAGPATAKAVLKEYMGAAAFETGVEILQGNYADAGTQALFAAFKKDVSAVDWEQVNKEAWASLPELVPVMLGLTAVGSGGAAIKNRVQANELARNPVLLRHAGFSPELVTSISQAKNPVAALQENWGQRAPLLAPAAPAVEDLGQVMNEAYAGGNAEYQTLVQGEMTRLAEQKAAMEREGITYARVEGGYEVRDSAAAPGSGVVFATPAEARAHAETLTNASLLHRDQVFQEALGTMLATMPTGREITILKADGNLLDQLITATDEGKTGDIGSIWARAQQQRAKEGGAPLNEDVADPASAEFLGGLTVLGRSETAFKERVARSVSTLYLRGNVIDLVEENAENDLRELVGNTASKPQRLAAIAASIRRVEAATGDTYLHGEENETSITEAWSDLVRLYTTGTRKAGNAITTGARKELAQELRGNRAATRAAQAKLQGAEKSNVEPGLFSRLRDHLTMLKTTLGQVARLMKAKREGKLADVEDFIRKSIGLDLDHANAEAVAKEAAASVRAAEDAAGVVTNGNGSVEYDPRAGFSLASSRVTPVDPTAERKDYANATVVGPTTFAIKAHHGTPHLVDKFSMDKIGTGEGAQAYGWGLYFAEAEAVGQKYANALSQSNNAILVNGASFDFITAGMAKDVASYDSPQEWAIAAKQRIADDAADKIRLSKERKDEMAWLIDQIESGANVQPEGKGNLYTVELDANDEDLLDWDKPLDEQSEKVQTAFNNWLKDPEAWNAIKSGTAGNWYGQWQSSARSKFQSETLLKAGIPGIRFLDGNSRGDGSGTYNYVMFSDAPIKITARNGEPVTYSLAPTARLQALEANLRARLAGAPEARLNILRDAQNKLQQLEWNYSTIRHTAAGDVIKPVSDRRTKESLDQEQRQRRADRELELTEPIERRYEVELNDTDRASLYAHPLIDFLLGKPAPGSNFRVGRMMPYNYAIKHGYIDRVNGEYDNRDGVPNMFFKGRQKVDDVAKEAFEAVPGEMRDDSPEALFDAIKRVIAETAKNRAAMRNAQDELKAAKEQARKEAADWRAERDAEQKRDHEPKAAMLRDLRTMEAILMTVPAEVRGKVGGMLALATAGSDTSRFIEMQNRIRILGEELERHFKKELTEQTSELLRRGQPEREPGKQMRGHLGVEGHRAFKEMLKVYQMDANELQAHQKALDAQQAEADPADEALLVALFEQMQIADYFGSWKRKSAVDMDAALKFAQDIWQEGRNKWGAVEMARLQEMKKLAAAVVEANGGVSYAGITGTREKGQKVLPTLKSLSIDLKSFHEILTALLGKDNAVAKRWTDAVRSGFFRKEAAVAAANVRFKKAVEAASGKRGRMARRWLWDLAHGRNLTITTAGKLVTTTEDVPIEIYQKMRSGEVEFAQLGYTKEDVAALTQAYQARMEEIARLRDIGEDFTANGLSARASIPLERSSRGEAEHVPMTPAEALFLSMIHGQEQYRDALDKHGWDAQAFGEIEDALSPETKQLRSFLSQEYKEGYGPMAQVFRRMFGVDLPSIRNYAPASFYHTGVDNPPGPDGNAVNPEGGFRAGFLANRKQHTAPPKLENAFAVWNGHIAQGAHWQNLAEVAREMKSVFSRPEVKMAIEGQHGKEMMNAVNDWIRSIEGNGLSISAGVIDKFANWLTGVQANIVLAYNIGTVAKQSTALLGAWYQMPTGDYLKGLSRLLTGQLDYRGMLQSPLIQARLENGYSPEVRAIKSTLWNAPPTAWADFRNFGLEIIGGADALFTTGSAAIAYDYHFRRAKQSGLDDTQADAHALAETERIVSQTAQPATLPDKSLFENRGNAVAKLLFLFASEARQKTSLYLSAWGNIVRGDGSKADIRVLAISHLVVAPMIQAISAMLRDAMDGDDDEIFDIDHWKPMDFIKAATFGPFGGFPILAQALSGFAQKGILGRFTDAINSIEKLMGDEPMSLQEKVNAAAKVGQGTTATIGVLAHMVQQAFGLVHNLVDDSENEGRKQLLKESKAKAEAKTEGLTPAELEAMAEEKKRKAREKTQQERAAAAARRASNG